MKIALKAPILFRLTAIAIMPLTTAVVAHEAGVNMANTASVTLLSPGLTSQTNMVNAPIIATGAAKSAQVSPARISLVNTLGSTTPSSQATSTTAIGQEKTTASQATISNPTQPTKNATLANAALLSQNANPTSQRVTATSLAVSPVTTAAPSQAPAPVAVPTTSKPIATTTTSTTAATPTTTTPLGTIGYSSFPTNNQGTPGQTYGPWFVDFNGYGSINRVNDPVLGPSLNLSPAVANASNVTHSALVTTTSNYGNFNATFTYRTISQLRTGTPPNPWEEGWVLFHYTNNTHFYYFLAKPTGWELGKEDPSYRGNQRFMATGSSPTFPVGATYKINVIMNGSTISVSVNGTPIVTFTDNQNPYLSGSFGLYDEDSSVDYGPLQIN